MVPKNAEEMCFPVQVGILDLRCEGHSYAFMSILILQNVLLNQELQVHEVHMNKLSYNSV